MAMQSRPPADAPQATEADEALARVAARISQPPQVTDELGHIDLPEGAAGAQRVIVSLGTNGRPEVRGPAREFRTSVDAKKLMMLDTSEGQGALDTFCDTLDALDPTIGIHVRAKVLTAQTRVRAALGGKAVDHMSGKVNASTLADKASKAEEAALRRAEKLGQPAPDLDAVRQASIGRQLTALQRTERAALYWGLSQAVASAAVLAKETFEAGKAARLKARAERRPMTEGERAAVEAAHAAKAVQATIPAAQAALERLENEGEAEGPRS